MKKEALQDPTFWLHLLATLLSAVSTSGLVTDDKYSRLLGIGLFMLNALGAGHAYGNADPNALPGPITAPLTVDAKPSPSTQPVPGLDRS